MPSTDLVISSDVARTFPTLAAGLERAERIFHEIRNFEDVERIFLKGAGLSPNTYRAYLGAVKDFYTYTEGLNPLQVTAAHIEGWYDNLSTRCGRATARLRVAGLKRFFAGVRNVLPIYTSPFELMPEKLIQKLQRSPKGRRTKKAMTTGEIRELLSFLELDKSEAGRTNHAMVFLAVTSGLRASELAALTWGDLDCEDGKWVARFVGKGEKAAEQELYGPAVTACLELYRARSRRTVPLPADALFVTSPTFNQEPAQMNAHVFWDRMRLIGTRARAAGVIKRDLQFSPHLLRRSYATLLYTSGMGLKAIQTKTRHSSITTLTEHYIDDSTPAAPFLEKALA